MTGGKGIQRIERYNRSRRGADKGWQARVPWKGQRHTKWFSDAEHGGKEKARLAAIDWRNDKERRLRKPRSEKRVYHAYFHMVPAKSNTGHLGVYEAVKEGDPVFVVTWAPEKGKVSATSVAIKKWGREEALRRALAIRRRKVADRKTAERRRAAA